MSEPGVVLRGFTPATFRLLLSLVGAVERVPEDANRIVLRRGAAIHLLHTLRARPDAGFPGGKWATIQHLEGCIAGDHEG